MSTRSLSVGDLMSTALIVARERESVTEADLEMRMAHIRHLPVVDERNHVVGILSDRDLLRVLGQGGRKAVPVFEIMTRSVRTVRPDTPAREAARLMLQHKIGALPVVGDDARIVGMITETDFLGLALECLGGDASVLGE